MLTVPSLRLSRGGYKNDKPDDLPRILQQPFKVRVLNYFRNPIGESQTQKQIEQLKKAMSKELDKFLNQRTDIRERGYFNNLKTDIEHPPRKN